MAYIKKFDTWNEKKKQIDSSTKNTSPYVHEGEVWWTSVGVNVGVEIDGKNNRFERPVMIVRKFGGEQFLGIPLTSKEKKGVFYIPVTYGDDEGTVCLSQIRVFSIKRVLRKISRVKRDELERIQTVLAQLIETGRV